MTTPSSEDPRPTDIQPPPPTQGGPYEEGKRAGAHPFLVIIVVILSLWFGLWLYIPSSKHQRATSPEPTPAAFGLAPSEAQVMFHVNTTIPELKVIIVVVPRQATDSQVAGLLHRFRAARLDNTLSTLLPATTRGHELSDNALAEIYVFSDPDFANPEAAGVLARGAHAPGELYPRAIPFEVAMERVRGHYLIDLHDTGHPDQGSLGFADEAGVHSKNYRPLF